MTEDDMTPVFDMDGWVCPVPLRDHPNVILGHGGGGKLSSELVEHVFLPAFRNPALEDRRPQPCPCAGPSIT